jgi:hypothetical protein
MQTKHIICIDSTSQYLPLIPFDDDIFSATVPQVDGAFALLAAAAVQCF